MKIKKLTPAGFSPAGIFNENYFQNACKVIGSFAQKELTKTLVDGIL